MVNVFVKIFPGYTIISLYKHIIMFRHFVYHYLRHYSYMDNEHVYEKIEHFI